MEKKKIEKIVRKIIKKDYPEFSDIVPYIEEKEISISENEFKKAKMKPVGKKSVWVAVFRKYFKSEDGTEIEKTIRATISKDGEIIKITESH